jgi:hypothetical protein
VRQGPSFEDALHAFTTTILPHLIGDTARNHTLVRSKDLPKFLNVTATKQWKCRVCGTNASEACVQCTSITDLGASCVHAVHSKCLRQHVHLFHEAYGVCAK